MSRGKEREKKIAGRGNRKKGGSRNSEEKPRRRELLSCPPPIGAAVGKWLLLHPAGPEQLPEPPWEKRVLFPQEKPCPLKRDPSSHHWPFSCLVDSSSPISGCLAQGGRSGGGSHHWAPPPAQTCSSHIQFYPLPASPFTPKTLDTSATGAGATCPVDSEARHTLVPPSFPEVAKVFRARLQNF